MEIPIQTTMGSLSRPTFSLEKWASELAVVGACVFIAGLALPVWSNLSLIVLACSGLFVIYFRGINRRFPRAPLLFPMLLFLGVTGLSILRSEDIGRSLRLSAPLVPALLLFFLIGDYFQGPRHTLLLYFTLSAVGLGLSLEVLWHASSKGFVIPEGWHNWISDLRSPLLIVPNDTVLLAIIAPLSLALLMRESGNGRKVLPGVSILLSILAVGVIQSRIATLTIIVSIVSAAALLRPRLAFAAGLAVLAVTLLLDASLGFPLSSRFSLLWDPRIDHVWGGRIPVWSAAWTGFVTSPILGHGPRTFDYVSPASIHLRWAHNLYLETLSEQGITGLAALGLLLSSGLSTARTANCAELPETRFLGAGAFAALIGFCVAAFFELSFLRQWVVVIFFTLLAVIAQLGWNRREQEENI